MALGSTKAVHRKALYRAMRTAKKTRPKTCAGAISLFERGMRALVEAKHAGAPGRPQWRGIRTKLANNVKRACGCSKRR